MKKPGAPARPRPAGVITTPLQRGPAPQPSAQQRVAARKRHQAAVKAAATRKKHAAAAKKAGKKAKPRKLARPGENCVLDACYALTGHWLDADAEEGLFIPDALEMLAALGLISGFGVADPGDPAALILGVDLPGPHAVLTVPGGWWSWGELYDPAAFPGAVIEEAWAVTW